MGQRWDNYGITKKQLKTGIKEMKKTPEKKSLKKRALIFNLPDYFFERITKEPYIKLETSIDFTIY